MYAGVPGGVPGSSAVRSVSQPDNGEQVRGSITEIAFSASHTLPVDDDDRDGRESSAPRWMVQTSRAGTASTGGCGVHVLAIIVGSLGDRNGLCVCVESTLQVRSVLPRSGLCSLHSPLANVLLPSAE